MNKQEHYGNLSLIETLSLIEAMIKNELPEELFIFEEKSYNKNVFLFKHNENIQYIIWKEEGIYSFGSVPTFINSTYIYKFSLYENCNWVHIKEYFDLWCKHIREVELPAYNKLIQIRNKKE